MATGIAISSTGQFSLALGSSGGTDAHAKNYSLLLANGPTVRLAPLYDIASILTYDDVDLQKMKLAMKIGGEYKLGQIGGGNSPAKSVSMRKKSLRD
ncbi:HipA domain-containing protein [Bradyrhizobium sp. BRP56]|uniref:HipA domain-containing protein n=1 Tax=Bradyrhizobium sp. BRP56 TaxID=2793819 RepID=UPI001CD39CBF|nr:HipA domain-containing protein [Bradyrhizobium sp. BRP56]